jgi:tellurite resistance protein TerC
VFQPLARNWVAFEILPQGLKSIVRTVEQVRRIFRIIAGFTLLLAGIIMIVTPGPGWLVILLGLGLLAAEFVWARRLMDRIKREGGRVREAVWRPSKTVVGEPARESTEAE